MISDSYFNLRLSSSLAKKIASQLSQEYKSEDFPCLLKQVEEFSVSKPFDGKVIADATPLFLNTTAKYIPLIEGGAKLLLLLDSRIPHDKKQADFLEKAGIIIQDAGSCFEGIDILLDCAAANQRICPKYGVVELTRSGCDFYKGSGKSWFSVDSTPVKLIEDQFGTADGLVRAFVQLKIELVGKRVLIFGGGKVGSGVAARLYRERAQVSVVDDVSLLPQNIPVKTVDRYSSEQIRSAIETADIIVTATGVPGAATQNARAEWFLRDGLLLVNLGVDDEFGPEIPADKVLNKKRPLNFVLNEPTRLKYLDATFALSNACARLLVTKNNCQNDGKVPEEEIKKILRQAGDSNMDNDIWQNLKFE